MIQAFIYIAVYVPLLALSVANDCLDTATPSMLADALLKRIEMLERENKKLNAMLSESKCSAEDAEDPTVMTSAGGSSKTAVTYSDGRNCTFSLQRRRDGGMKRVISPTCFPNPGLSIHTLKRKQVGLGRKLCRKIIRAAEKAHVWDQKGVIGDTRTYDLDLQEIIPSLKESEIAKLEKLIGQTFGNFIIANLIQKRPGIDGKKWKGVASSSFNYQESVVLKGMPFVVKYEVGVDSGVETNGIVMHKDNADASFIVMLSEEGKDFEGGGTVFEALGEDKPVPLRQGEALVFSGQLVHGAAPISRGKRYVLSGFTKFSEDYVKMKRLGTLATTIHLD